VVLTQQDLITVDGIPAHPLLVHAVVVLLPLAALGGLVIAARATWRRRFGVAVLLLTAAGVAAVPLATRTGNQLKAVLPANPKIDQHAALGDNVLPFALAFGVAVLLLVIAGRLADRERDAAASGSRAAAAGSSAAAAAGPSAAAVEPSAAAVGPSAAGAEPRAAAAEPSTGASAPSAGASGKGPPAAGPGAATEGDVRVTRTWRRIAIVAAALVAFTGVATTVQIVRVGHSGSVAVWQGTGG
jgi:hypothetical protein